MTDAPVPGWAPADEADALGDPARRPVGELIGEVFSTYRAHAGPAIGLAVAIEGGLTLVSLPYVVLSFGPIFALVAQLVERFTSGRAVWSTGESLRFLDAYRRLADPLLAALGGVVSVLPLASVILLSATLATIILGPDAATRTLAGALRAVLRRWTAIIAPIVVLGAGAALMSAWSALVTGGLAESPGPGFALLRFGLSVILALLTPVALAAAAYLAVRWAVAIPAIVLEGLGLRAGLARSAALTRTRMVHVGITLLAAFGITWIGSSLVALPAGLLALLIVAGGGGPPLALPITLYLAGRIALAPVLPILTAILYRDLRDAGTR